MPLEIIGAGFGRTGTLSTCQALNQLGLSCYHMDEVTKNPRNKSHLAFWCRVAQQPAGQQHDWQRVFANYRAVIDFPAAAVWQELLLAYPDAKVLLTLHPGGAEAWYESTRATIFPRKSSWQIAILKWVTPRGRKFFQMSRLLIEERALQRTLEDRAAALVRYNNHIADVKAAVPVERLLVFSVDQGWGPLCRFLEKPEPTTPFPKVNDRAAFKRMTNHFKRYAYGILGLGAGLLIAIGFGLAQLF